MTSGKRLVRAKHKARINRLRRAGQLPPLKAKDFDILPWWMEERWQLVEKSKLGE